MNHPPKKTHAFLAAIRSFPHISRAAKAAGINRATHYRRYDKDPAYREAFDQAWRWGTGILRDEAIRRVLLGYEEPVIYQGQYQYDEKTGRMVTVTKYPERLTMKVLGAEIPDTYNRQRVELTGRDGGPIQKRILLEFVDPPKPKE